MEGKRSERLLFLIWTALGILVMAGSYELNVGSFGRPGPGMAPFLAGGALFLLSVLLTAKSFRRRPVPGVPEDPAAPARIDTGKIALLSGSVVAYALLLEKVGYLLMTFFLLLLLFRIGGHSRWRVILAGVLPAVLGTYVFFSLVGVSFPAGILGFF